MSQEAEGLRLIAKHINGVQSYMHAAINNMISRLVKHDISKYDDDEKELVIGKAELDTLAVNLVG